MEREDHAAAGSSRNGRRREPGRPRHGRREPPDPARPTLRTRTCGARASRSPAPPATTAPGRQRRRAGVPRRRGQRAALPPARPTRSTSGPWAPTGTCSSPVHEPPHGRVQVRSIPFDEIDDVITNPDDRDDPWYYSGRWTARSVHRDDGRGATTADRARTAYYPALTYRPRPAPAGSTGTPCCGTHRSGTSGSTGWTGGRSGSVTLTRRSRGPARTGTSSGTGRSWSRPCRSSRSAHTSKRGSKAQKVREGLADGAGSGETRRCDRGLGPDATWRRSRRPARPSTPSRGGRWRRWSPPPWSPGHHPAHRPGADRCAGRRGDPGQADRPGMGMRRGLWADAEREVLGYVIEQAVKAPAGRCGARSCGTRSPVGRSSPWPGTRTGRWRWSGRRWTRRTRRSWSRRSSQRTRREAAPGGGREAAPAGPGGEGRRLVLEQWSTRTTPGSTRSPRPPRPGSRRWGPVDDDPGAGPAVPEETA